MTYEKRTSKEEFEAIKYMKLESRELEMRECYI